MLPFEELPEEHVHEEEVLPWIEDGRRREGLAWLSKFGETFLEPQAPETLLRSAVPRLSLKNS